MSDVGQIETAFRPRGGSFGDASCDLRHRRGAHALRAPIATDDSAALVWTAATPTGGLRVQSAFRPKDGAFGAVQTLTDHLLYGLEPQVAVDERGNALAVWTLTEMIADGVPVVRPLRPRSIRLPPD